MSTKSLWLALSLLCTGGIVACEEKSPLEDAAEDVADKAEDIKDKAD